MVIDELKFNTFGDKIKELINDLKELDKLVYAEETEEDDKKAREIRKQRQTPLNDTKHAVIAKRAKAIYFVTRNVKDFEELQDLIKVTFPETL